MSNPLIDKKDTLDNYDEVMQRKIKSLAMPVSEIVSRFEKTEGKAKDLQILAELNGCSRNDIQIIIETELGTEELPKQMTKLTNKKKSPAPVPANQQKKKVQEKVKVNHYAMQAVQIALEQVDDQLKELESQIAVLQQQKEELKTAYNAYVQFMEEFEEE